MNVQARRAMRASNSPASVAASREAHESRSATLKSDLKRITALKGKMKSLMEEGKEAVLKDIASLNLHMFVEELVTAIAESKLKPGDILAAVCHSYIIGTIEGYTGTQGGCFPA